MSLSNNLFAKHLPLLAVTALALVGARAQQIPTAPATNNLVLWMRADTGVTADASGAVSLWEDQSPNGFDAAQIEAASMPKFVTNSVNGKPVIHFDGADDPEQDFLDVVSAPGLDIVGDIASFAVVRVDDYANYNSIWGKTAGADGNIPAPNDWYLIQGSGIPQFFRGDGAAAVNVAGQRPVREDTYAVIGFKQTGTTVTHYLNGTTNGVGELDVLPFDAGTNLRIGSREDRFTKLKGDLAELLIFNGTITDEEVTTTVEYLRNKYAILNSAPIVSITTPAGDVTNAAPANLNVVVSAVDDDGSISRVDLLANGNVIASATAAPYRFPISLDTPGTVTLTAVAIDDKDATTTSSNRLVTISGAVPALESNPNLKLWLKGDAGLTVDGDRVTAWADQSGNNNDAVQGDINFAPAAGTLDGKPAVTFAAQNDFLEIPDSPSLSITGDIASFFVVRFVDYSGFRAVWSKSSESQPRPTDYYLTQNGGVPNLLRGYPTNDVDGAEIGVNQSVAGAGRVAPGVPALLGFQQAGSNVTHYYNGRTFGTGTITLLPQDLDTTLKIGARDDFGTLMKGEIAELLIFDAALSSNQLANVRQYLGAKYNLPLVQNVNVAPTVTLTPPAGGSTVAAGSEITLSATAADTDGSVVRVDFLANGTPVASDSTAPYSATFRVNAGTQISLSAVAVDNLGARTTAAATSVTVTGGEPANIPTDGLVLWLRPDRGVTTNASGAVTLWEDWSGNFNNARQADAAKAPTIVGNGLNGLNVLRFDGADDYLIVTHSPSLAVAADMSTFFVVNVEDYGTYRAIWGKTAGNLPAANDYYLLPNDGRPRFYHGTPGGALGNITGTDPIPTGTFVTGGYALAGTTATHYLNGAENGSGEITAPGTDTGAPLLIGTRADFVTRFKGSFAELVIFNRALTEQERTSLENYFQAKYFGPAPTDAILSVSRAANNSIVISWEASLGGTLESSPTLGSTANWTAAPETVVPNGQSSTVTATASTGTRFFRLRR